MAQITALHVYPVKGLRGVSLSQVQVERRGFQHDRRWMLVDAERTFLSQRNTPKMATLGLELGDDGLNISHPDSGSINVPFQPTGPTTDVQVWKNTVTSQIVSAEIDAWFTELLGQTCSLVAMTNASDRPVHPDFSNPGDQVSFADAFPILVTTEASLDDLNRRLPTPIPMNRFRANVVVDGVEAWSEDDWERVQLGQLSFRAAKHCGRCLVTTTDQLTGERGIEPLKTLATFRKVNQVVYFGTYIIPDELGLLRVGESLQV